MASQYQVMTEGTSITMSKILALKASVRLLNLEHAAVATEKEKGQDCMS